MIFGTRRYFYPDHTDEETGSQRFGDVLRVTQLVKSRAIFKSRSQHEAFRGAQCLESWTLEKREDTARVKGNQETFR